VAAVITHDDVPKLSFTRRCWPRFAPLVYEGENQDQFILSEKARYVGDWVAAVAAIDIYTAEKALDLIEVEYDPLPAVFDPEEAQRPGAPSSTIDARQHRRSHRTSLQPRDVGEPLQSLTT